MKADDRLYRLLLRLYPPAFRERYGDELLELFRDRSERRHAAGHPTRIAFWRWILTDFARTAWGEWTRPGARSEPRMTGGGGMGGVLDDLRYAARRLRRSPGFSATAILILALGIGVGTAAFAFVNALLFQTPPFEDPSRVVFVLQDADDGVPNSTSYPAYLDIRDVRGVFSEVAAHSTSAVYVEQEDALVPALAEYATSSYLRVLGLTPSRGRWFDASADDPTGPPAAVLTHRMWADRFGADPGVLGSTLRIGGSTITVVGVGPEEFNGGVGPGVVDLWLSISAMGPTGGRAASLARRQDHPFQVRARLAPGVGIAEASDAMDRLERDLAARFPEINAERAITVLPVDRGIGTAQGRSSVLPAAALSMGVVGLVLLVGTLNLANLLLVRTTTRARELAVRLALGSSRVRLVRVVLSEAMLLAGLGGLAGALITLGAVAALPRQTLGLGFTTALDLRLDAGVLLFAVAVSIGTGLVFGLVPALRATSAGVRPGLAEEGGSVIGARRRFGLTGVLVAGQVTVSLLLLAVAGVFLESLARAQAADPGFDWEGTAFVSLATQPLDLDAGAAVDLHDRLAARIGALPEVRSVAVSAVLPGRMFGTTTLLLGSGTGGVDRPSEVPWNYVESAFFDVLGIPVLEGRAFVDEDADGPPVAIVSRAMAMAYWGHVEVVGQSFTAESSPEAPIEIVGVVGDVTVRSLGEPPRPTVYYPTRGALSRLSYVFTSDGPPGAALGAVRSAVAEVDGRILVLAASSMRQHLGETLDRQRLAGSVLGGLGTLALALALIGLYGVVSFAVSRRKHEVGVRIALGASRDAVVALFVRDVAFVVLAGGALGVALALPLANAVGRMFTGAPGSPLAVLVPAGLFAATGFVATLVPAVRATRTDPTLALRQD